MLQPSPVPASPFVERLRTGAGRRTLAISLAALIEGLLLLLLLTLSSEEPSGKKEEGITVVAAAGGGAACAATPGNRGTTASATRRTESSADRARRHADAAPTATVRRYSLELPSASSIGQATLRATG